ncbi:MAG: amidohydrolase, partial [Gemmatimonadetes bacterium]|nr:amidohydrolase [Gemmatimonadota bacterium]
MRAIVRRGVLKAILAVALGLPAGLYAQQSGGGGGMEETTRRRSDEGGGPYDRLVIRGVTIIDGTGAPPRGPVNIVIEGDRIVRVGGGFRRPDQPAETQGNTREIDGT